MSLNPGGHVPLPYIIGLGEPCFDKLEAKMAHAMLSLPATKVKTAHPPFSVVICPPPSHRGVPPPSPPFHCRRRHRLSHHLSALLPRRQGFETGSGFEGTKQRGSAHNDQFIPSTGPISSPLLPPSPSTCLASHYTSNHTWQLKAFVYAYVGRHARYAASGENAQFSNPSSPLSSPLSNL